MESFSLDELSSAVKKYGVNIGNIRVLQNDQCIAKQDWAPDIPKNVYSVTKSITSIAVGFAVQEGLFCLEDRVVDHFRGDLPEFVSANLADMKLIHLITMSMGFRTQYLMGNSRIALFESEPDWVKYVLRQPVDYKPGTKFLYNNAGPYLLGVLIQRKTGMSLIDYLMPRLFEPLNISKPEISHCPMGYDFGAGGLILTVEDLAKIGQLYLDQGVWGGKQLIRREWVEQSCKPYIRSDNDASAANGAIYTEGDLGSYYGYLFWIVNDDVYAARGKFGQYCIICKSKQAVISALSDEKKDHRLIMWLLEKFVLDKLQPRR